MQRAAENSACPKIEPHGTTCGGEKSTHGVTDQRHSLGDKRWCEMV